MYFKNTPALPLELHGGPLMMLHAYTGCGHTSAFLNRGSKLKHYTFQRKILKNTNLNGLLFVCSNPHCECIDDVHGELIT